MPLSRCLLILILFTTPVAFADPPPATRPADPHAYLLHLPGVSGEAYVDHTFVGGLKRGGFPAEIEIYDWTEHDPGIPALQAMDRNIHQAQLIADKLAAKFHADPRLKIYLTSHSGGAGLAVGALARLPKEVQIESLLMLAPALWPEYDLSKALRHVRGSAYSFYSHNDGVVLSVGTRTFGTIDGVHSDAAGYVGFTRPPTADLEQYKKLIQFPYDDRWVAVDNIGDHIGPMSTPFVQQIIVPVLEHGPSSGQITKPAAAPTTQP